MLMVSGRGTLWMLMIMVCRGTEGFKLQPLAKVSKMMETEEFKSGVPDIVGTLGGVANVVQIDYKANPKEVIKNVGEALIPLIATGLALIPGGALIGGIIIGVWGVLSSFLGSPGKSPMQLAVEDIQKDLESVKDYVNNLAQKLPEEMRKETHAKLASIVERAIGGELSRNKYICNKYAIISRDFITEMRNNRTINESRRIEMIATIHDCDNFLRDTADAFVYPEFADVLWIPSVFTTFQRASFLTEISNYGVSLNLDKAMISLFLREMKKDINRHFEFAVAAMAQRMNIHFGGGYSKLLDRHFLPAEIEACKIQAELLFIDRAVYPYGVPKQFLIYDNDTELNIENFNVTNKARPQHIQIFYNDLRSDFDDDFVTFWQCYMGPTVRRIYGNGNFSFPINYVPNKSYQIRVLYFAGLNDYLCGKSLRSWFSSSNKKAVAFQESNNVIKVSLTDGKINENNPQRFTWKSAYHIMRCPFSDEHNINTNYYKICTNGCEGVDGMFVIESVATFNVLPNDEKKGRIIIEADDTIVISGAELIIFPTIS